MNDSISKWNIYSTYQNNCTVSIPLLLRAIMIQSYLKPIIYNAHSELARCITCTSASIPAKSRVMQCEARQQNRQDVNILRYRQISGTTNLRSAERGSEMVAMNQSSVQSLKIPSNSEGFAVELMCVFERSVDRAHGCRMFSCVD